MKVLTKKEAQQKLIKLLKDEYGFELEYAKDVVNESGSRYVIHPDHKGFSLTKSAMRGLERTHYRLKGQNGLLEVGWEYRNTRGDDNGKWRPQEAESMLKMNKIRESWKNKNS